MANSYSLDISSKKLLRVVLSSSVGKNNTGTLVRKVDPLLNDLNPEQIDCIINTCIDTYKLRTSPLVIAVVALKQGKLINPKQQITKCLVRADLCCVALDVYRHLNGKTPFANSLKNAIREKLPTFSDYDLIKGAVGTSNFKLKDVLNIVHPLPKDDAQSILFKQILEGNTPKLDNWETVISGASSISEKIMQWERLLLDDKIKNVALLRNLSNLMLHNVNFDIICQKLGELDFDKVNIFHVLSALLNIKTKYPSLVPKLNSIVEEKATPELDGETLIILDVSGSMGFEPEAKNFLGIASMLAYYAIKSSNNPTLLYTAGGYTIQKVASQYYQGDLATSKFEDICLGIRTARETIGYGGIFTRQCIDEVKATGIQYKRIIVISDSADSDNSGVKATPNGQYNYLLDISGESNNVIFDNNWDLEINGWSESLIDIIKKYEASS